MLNHHKTEMLNFCVHIFSWFFPSNIWLLPSINFLHFVPLGQIEPILDAIILGCSSSKIVSGDLAQYPRWLSLVKKLEIFKNLLNQGNTRWNESKFNLVIVQPYFKIMSIDSVYYLRWPPLLIMHLFVFQHHINYIEIDKILV